MNPISSRLKAIAITALFFALSGFALLGLIWGLNALPIAFPGQDALNAYRPHDTVAAVSDLRITVVLTAAFLVATAIVLILDSDYCDRMLAIFSDVLLMMMAAMSGFVAGYWALLRLAGYSNFITMDFIQAALICPVVVFAASILPLGRLRSVLPMRVGAALLVLLAAPVLLIVRF